jgi:hypothetical protein
MFQADKKELLQIEGMNEAKADLLLAVFELFRCLE